MQMVDRSVRVPTLSSGKPVLSHGTCPRRIDGGVAAAPQRILVVDDDVTVQEVLTFFLGPGYDVKHERTGADALTRLQFEPFELVVLDHRVPDCTGLDTLPELKS